MSLVDLPAVAPYRDPRPAGGRGSLDRRPIVGKTDGDEQQPAMPRM